MRENLNHINNNFITRLTPRGVQPLMFINAGKEMFNNVNVNIEFKLVNQMNRLMIEA